MTHEAGFSIHHDVIPPDETAALCAVVSTLPRSRAGARHLLGRPEIERIAGDVRLRALASEWLGAPAQPYRATLFDKSPGANWLVVWHQDTALPLRQRLDVAGWGPWSAKAGVVYAHAPASALARIVALRLHLDDSTAENGPLRVLPGTHELGVLTDAALQDLSTRIAPASCLVPRGGVLAMRPLLAHSSSRARTESPRRVLHFEYAASLALDAGLELAVA
jgi:ectoine hydroxylase-related dioxygenase (phytanoyl-CoA dioxygenase family)